jgi:arylamine N-acetyltransferase
MSYRVHIVNIVTLQNGDRWMVDVGFGGDGINQPALEAPLV